MNLVWRARARADLLDQVSYVARDNPSAAARMHEQILRMVGLLEAWPDLGRQGRRPDLRELAVAGTPYLVLYQRTAEAVVVLRVLHGRQNR